MFTLHAYGLHLYKLDKTSSTKIVSSSSGSIAENQIKGSMEYALVNTIIMLTSDKEIIQDVLVRIKPISTHGNCKSFCWKHFSQLFSE